MKKISIRMLKSVIKLAAQEHVKDKPLTELAGLTEMYCAKGGQEKAEKTMNEIVRNYPIADKNLQEIAEQINVPRIYIEAIKKELIKRVKTGKSVENKQFNGKIPKVELVSLKKGFKKMLTERTFDELIHIKKSIKDGTGEFTLKHIKKGEVNPNRFKKYFEKEIKKELQKREEKLAKEYLAINEN